MCSSDLNMVAILTVPLMAVYDRGIVSSVRNAAAAIGYPIMDSFRYQDNQTFRVVAIVVAVACLAWAYWQSKRETGAPQ